MSDIDNDDAKEVLAGGPSLLFLVFCTCPVTFLPK
jgi:hypothetical protein